MIEVESYADYALQQKANGYNLFAENHSIISKIPVGGKVMDIGCGPGTVTQLLTYYTNLGAIYGTDVDLKMIESAKKRNSNSRIAFLVWDVQKPADSQEKFDLVTSNAVMHWISDQNAALRNIYDCLKPGGYFLAHFKARSIAYFEGTCLPDERKWRPYLNEERFALWMGTQHSWQVAENPGDFYRKMLEDNHQFEIIICEHRTIDSYYNEIELDAHCEMWANNLLQSEIPKEKRKEFIAELKESTKNKWRCISTDSGQFYSYTTERIVLVLRKPKNAGNSSN